MYEYELIKFKLYKVDKVDQTYKTLMSEELMLTNLNGSF